MPPEATEVIRWLEKADHDRAGAEAALAHVPPVTDVAAFHCQQAVEKLLKAYLVWRVAPFEKIHDLERLLDDCVRYDAEFAQLRPTVIPLTSYAVRFRYPGPADPTLAEAQDALHVAQSARNFVLSRLPAELRP